MKAYELAHMLKLASDEAGALAPVACLAPGSPPYVVKEVHVERHEDNSCTVWLDIEES